MHQIVNEPGIQGSYAQQQSSTTSTSTPSSSVSPSTRYCPQDFQQHRHQHQLYNFLPPQTHSSYSFSVSSLPRSKDFLHQHQQQQQHQRQQSNMKRDIMGKHLDTGNRSKNKDDPMPSTSDFVKKLYKFVHLSFLSLSFSLNINIFSLPIGFPYVCVGCSSANPGGPTVVLQQCYSSAATVPIATCSDCSVHSKGYHLHSASQLYGSTTVALP